MFTDGYNRWRTNTWKLSVYQRIDGRIKDYYVSNYRLKLCCFVVRSVTKRSKQHKREELLYYLN